MKNIYSAASLLAVAMLVAASFSAVPVQAFTPPSAYVTTVTLTCYGKTTAAISTITITHNHVPIGTVTLACSNVGFGLHSDSHTFITQLKPNDDHVQTTIRVGDLSHECRPSETKYALGADTCHYLRGSALVTFKLRPVTVR